MTQERMTAAEYQRQFGSGLPSQNVAPAPSKSPKIRLPGAQKMTKAEAEYGRILITEFNHRDYKIGFEEVTLRLPSGTKYTPDWIVWEGARIVLAVEVKGSYRLGSAGASAEKFKAAIKAYPAIAFRHASKSKDGWQISAPKPC